MSNSKISLLSSFFKKLLNNLYFKLFLTIIFLYVVFFEINLNSLLLIIKDSNYYCILLSVVIFFINSFISVWRLLLSFAFFNKKLSYIALLKVHFIGIFYNFFLPSPIGGDVSKILYFPEGTKEKFALSVILFDRMIGFGTLLLVTIISIFYNKELTLNFQQIPTYLILILLLVITLFALLALKFFKKQMLTIFSKVKSLSYPNFIYALLVSIVLQFSLIGFNYLIAQSLSFNLTFMQHALATGVVTAITVLPITISGYGIREISSIEFYSLFGISSEKTLAKLLIGYIIYFLGVILGWIYIVLNRNKGEINVDLQLNKKSK